MHYQTVGYLERGEYSPSLYLALRTPDEKALTDVNAHRPIAASQITRRSHPGSRTPCSCMACPDKGTVAMMAHELADLY